MPELPEVETVRRGLVPVMEGHTIRAVRLSRPDLRFPLPGDFAARLEGRRVESLSRRAKYLLARLDSDETLLMHLGMTGRFTVFAPGGRKLNLGDFYYEEPAQNAGSGVHDHVLFELDDGSLIVYTDPRRFGLMDIVRNGTPHPLLEGLGVEPLEPELNAEHLWGAFRGKRAPLKAALIDQRLIAGLGNIYACEALYRARLSPLRIASTLARRARPEQRLEALVEAIRAVLSRAIEEGGSTLRDYARIDGSPGGFQSVFDVYDREGQPCLRDGCPGMVRRIVQSGRSTFYCPRCQR